MVLGAKLDNVLAGEPYARMELNLVGDRLDGAHCQDLLELVDGEAARLATVI